MLRRLAATLFALAACSAPGASTTDGRPGGGDGQPGGPDGAAGQADATGPTADANRPGRPRLTIIGRARRDGRQQLVDAINAATTSVYMTMYELDDSDVITALAAREGRRRRPGDPRRLVDDNKSFNMDAYTR